MTSLYQMLSISKQAHSKARIRKQGVETANQQALNEAIEVRKTNPGMGCRSIYHAIGADLPMGRDRFESLLLENGFRVRFPRNYIRTTRSVKDRYFDNLIRGKTLTGLDQLWQSDIAYIFNNGRYYYLVFIIDVYSRRILGYQVHPHMMASANIKALKQAIAKRGKSSFPELIHHSDRGSQYTDKGYLNLLRQAGITPSMAKHCWENAYVERVNGTIKNQYLRKMDINGFEQLKTRLKQAIYQYNHFKPHLSLPNKLTPVDYEKAIEKGAVAPQPMTIYNPELSTFKHLSTKEKRTKKEKSHHHH